MTEKEYKTDPDKKKKDLFRYTPNTIYRNAIHYSAQASYFAVFRGIRDTKIEKVGESWTKFLFDVKRALDSTTVLVLDSTPILLL